MENQQNLSNKTNPEDFGETAGIVDLADFPKWILYEDENLIVVNKPGWLVCHPSKNGPCSSLVGAAREYLKLEVLHLVSRLDRETSGVIVMAKNKETASAAQKAVDGRGDVAKKYLAILEGHMIGSVTVSQPLADDKKSLVAIKTCCAMQKPSAKNAVTIFKPIALSQNSSLPPATLAEVEIITGRKHQIRAHAQWIGHNVVADKIYGHDETLYLDFVDGGFTPDMAKVLPMKRQALHAFSMDFTKVFNNPSMNFKAPLHKDFRDFMISRQISLPEEFDI